MSTIMNVSEAKARLSALISAAERGADRPWCFDSRFTRTDLAETTHCLDTHQRKSETTLAT